MQKNEEAKRLVTDYRKKHPGVSIKAAIEACGVSAHSYYYASKQQSRKKTVPPVASYSKVEAKKPEPKAAMPMPGTDAGKLFLIVGTPEQIRGMLK